MRHAVASLAVLLALAGALPASAVSNKDTPQVPPAPSNAPAPTKRGFSGLRAPGDATPDLPLAIRLAPQATRGTPDVQDTSRDLAYGAFQRGYYLTAVALATRQAENNDPAAQTLLGVLYERGFGVNQSVSTSASWYQLAAERGDPQAAYRLALYYLLGTGVERDETKAAELFELAAKKDLAGAIYNLGVLHMEGRGGKRDRAQALTLFERAAKQGDTDAQYSLALAYLETDEPMRDERLGAFWMGRAARGGNIPAQVRYAILRYNGRGVEPDKADAALWFQRAASAGNPVAMNRLARLYAYGQGIGFDPLEAATWHLVARDAGISDLWLDGYVESLDDKTRNEAAARAGQWQGLDNTADQPQTRVPAPAAQ